MNWVWLKIASDALQSAVLLVICVRTYMIMGLRRDFLPPVFFLFGMAAMLLSDLYWLVHDLIRPEYRFPYSAAEISADGAFLLLAAVLVILLGRSRDPMPWLTIGTIVFTLANIALWIAFSGEWFKDIFDGLIWLYYLYVVIRAARRTGGFSRPEWAVMVLTGAAYLILNAVYLFVPEAVQHTLIVVIYAIMYGTLLFLWWKVFRSLRDGSMPQRGLCLSYVGFTCSLLTMYMSGEPIYFLAMFSETVMMVMMHVFMERVVAET